MKSNWQEAGTDGLGLRGEALKINLVNAPAGASIKYQAHVQNVGWQNPVSDGTEAGTDGLGLRVEAIKISLVNMPGYSVQYQAHVQNIGWQTPVSDGQGAGTDGKGLRVEAIRIRIVKTSDGSTPTPVQFVTKGYVYNTELQTDLKVRSAANLNGTILGSLYNFQKIDILDTATDSIGNVWDKINYNNIDAYVSDSYIQSYTTPPDTVVNIAANITKQFESQTPNQIAGNSDGKDYLWVIFNGV